MRILHLEDDPDDLELIQMTLRKKGIVADRVVVSTAAQYLTALETADFDLILSDNQVPGLDGFTALQLAQQQRDGIPFIFVSGTDDDKTIKRVIAAGATAYVSKNDLSTLAAAIQLARQPDQPIADHHSPMFLRQLERLVAVIQELSLARDLATVIAIVRTTARELADADGATFVLREGNLCFYADEDAISPLWKGQRFPMTACISGWAMLNRQSVAIDDIYADPRIPADAYRPTFVKSLVMVPIRRATPIGAIGTYWAARHLATPDEVKLLQALADSTSIALENVQLYAELEQRVHDRTLQLEAANRELEAFSSAVSHDLRAPLRSIDGFSRLLLEDHAAALEGQAQEYLLRIRAATGRMGNLIDDLLNLSRVGRVAMHRQFVDLTQLAQEIVGALQASAPERRVEVSIAAGLVADGDPGLLQVLLDNLLANAWKFTTKTSPARIEVNCTTINGQLAYYVRDNGAGFDPQHASKLFNSFQRLHAQSDFPGTGVGLATVQRIVERHGGQVWASAAVNQGATFYFTLGQAG